MTLRNCENYNNKARCIVNNYVIITIDKQPEPSRRRHRHRRRRRRCHPFCILRD